MKILAEQDPVKKRSDIVDEQIDSFGKAVLAMTLGCARCHDHKFDPVVQRDYYALYATFAGVEHGSRPMATPQEKAERAERLKPLQEDRERLGQQIAAIEKSINERAEQEAPELEQNWHRPSVTRTGTEETYFMEDLPENALGADSCH